MVIPTTRADVFIWCVIAVLLVLDWYIGGMVYNRPPVMKNDKMNRRSATKKTSAK